MGTLILIVREKIQSGSIVILRTLFPATALLDVSEFKHCRTDHSKLFAGRQNRIGGIGNFRNRAKRRLRKFNGIPRERFHLFPKEAVGMPLTILQEISSRQSPICRRQFRRGALRSVWAFFPTMINFIVPASSNRPLPFPTLR